MPELPEVERFRQILLPMVNETCDIEFELVGEKPPRKWISVEDVNANNGKWHCQDVIRKGKQLCMVLKEHTSKVKDTKEYNSKSKSMYFYLHMGMTGRIISPTLSCSWGHKYVSKDSDNETWPPRFTYLIMTSGKEKVAFADPRKFGACYFLDHSSSSSVFDDLAPDALLETKTTKQCKIIASDIANQRLGIKAIILDQKRVVSGVGNWVADEVLYQCELHPDQSYLTEDQALQVITKLHSILSIAVDCLNRDIPYPDNWVFGYRWTMKKAGKDHMGRSLSFLTSGGRTSAIVASIQKLRKGQKREVGGGEVKQEKVMKRVSSKRKVSSKVEGKTSSGEETDKPTTSQKRKLNNDVIRKAKKRKEDTEHINSTTANIRRSCRNTRSIKSHSETKEQILNEIGSKTDSYEHKKQPKKTSAKEKMTMSKQIINISDKGKVDAIEGKGDVERLQPDKRETLNKVDSSIRKDFLKLGFARWGKSWLPIIQLGPYDVAPGPVRDTWMNFFLNVSCTMSLSFCGEFVILISFFLPAFIKRPKRDQGWYIGTDQAKKIFQNLFHF